jgi:hypothetical protein
MRYWKVEIAYVDTDYPQPLRLVGYETITDELMKSLAPAERDAVEMTAGRVFEDVQRQVRRDAS